MRTHLSRWAVPAVTLSAAALVTQIAGLACSTSATDTSSGAANDAGDASPTSPSPDATPDATSATECAELAAIDEAAANVPSEADDGRHTGFVGLTQKLENGSQTASAGANFWERAADAGDAGLPPCTTTTIANCTLRECLLVDAGVAPPPANPKAGRIFVTSPRFPDAGCNSLVMSPSAYGTTVSGGKIYEPGDTVFVRAEGDPNGVPPFSVSLLGPVQVATTTPVLGGYDDPNVFSKSTDGTIAWSPAGPGTIEVTFQASSSGKGQILTCRGDASVGSMTIPKDAFASFDTVAAGGRSGGIIVAGRTAKTVAAGKYRVEVDIDTVELHGSYRLGD